jgi:hypothetical protein
MATTIEIIAFYLYDSDLLIDNTSMEHFRKSFQNILVKIVIQNVSKIILINLR